MVDIFKSPRPSARLSIRISSQLFRFPIDSLISNLFYGFIRMEQTYLAITLYLLSDINLLYRGTFPFFTLWNVEENFRQNWTE